MFSKEIKLMSTTNTVVLSFDRENNYGWSCQGLNSKLMTDL